MKCNVIETYLPALHVRKVSNSGTCTVNCLYNALTAKRHKTCTNYNKEEEEEEGEEDGDEDRKVNEKRKRRGEINICKKSSLSRQVYKSGKRRKKD